MHLTEPHSEPLSERQCMVLRAVVAAWVGEAAPVGSRTLSHWLPVHLSAASVRNTMAELEERGLIEKPHASAGRVPTEAGLRIFVDQLMSPARVADYEQRTLEHVFEGTAGDAVMERASQVLSDRTRQLGFVLAPRLERAPLRHVSLVRVSTDRLLVVLVASSGQAYHRVVDDRGTGDQAELERIAAALNERIHDRTLPEVRAILEAEARALRDHANELLMRALDIGARALAPAEADLRGDLVIATRLALLDQPEFRDPVRLRELFAALETREQLVDLIDGVLRGGDVSVAFGAEAPDPALRGCALVVAPYGEQARPLGALGVIGPNRMDFVRIVPLVGYLSRLVTEKLSA